MITGFKELAGRSGVIGEDSTRSFLFFTDSPNHTEHDIYFNRNCPRIGSQHPNRKFSLFYLKRGNLTVSQRSGSERLLWDVVAKYTQLEAGEEPPEEQTEPQASEFEEPDFQPHVSIEFEDYSAPIELGINTSGAYDADSPAGFGAYPVVNSALEPYETPPEIFKQNTIIRVTKNMRLRNSLWKTARSLKNTVNTDRFTYRRGTYVESVEPYQCRLKIRIGEQQEYRDKSGRLRSYANLECQFIIKEITWNVDILDHGTVYLDTPGKTIATRIADDDWGLAGGTKQLPIEDDNRNNIPGLLDGTGERLTAGEASVFNRYPGYRNEKHASFFRRITRRLPQRRR